MSNENVKYPKWITAVNTLNDTPEMTRRVYNLQEDLDAREDYKALFKNNHRIEYSDHEPFLGW